MPLVVHAIGLQLLAWALGMSVTVVLLDSSCGLVRDHPPQAWRAAGMASGPLALLSLLCMLQGGAPRWVALGLVLPFALLALGWSWDWYRRCGAELRRRRGREALILGLISLLFTALEQSAGGHLPVQVLAATAGSAALVGGLGALLLSASLGRGRDEVAVEVNPYGVPARVVATGLGITLLAVFDTGQSLLSGGEGAITLLLGLWAACSLLLPLGLVAAGHRLFPRWQPPIWATALGAVLVGQFALNAAIYWA